MWFSRTYHVRLLFGSSWGAVLQSREVESFAVQRSVAFLGAKAVSNEQVGVEHKHVEFVEQGCVALFEPGRRQSRQHEYLTQPTHVFHMPQRFVTGDYSVFDVDVQRFQNPVSASCVVFSSEPRHRLCVPLTLSSAHAHFILYTLKRSSASLEVLEVEHHGLVSS